MSQRSCKTLKKTESRNLKDLALVVKILFSRLCNIQNTFDLKKDMLQFYREVAEFFCTSSFPKHSHPSKRFFADNYPQKNALNQSDIHYFLLL